MVVADLPLLPHIGAKMCAITPAQREWHYGWTPVVQRPSDPRGPDGRDYLFLKDQLSNCNALSELGGDVWLLGFLGCS